MNPNFNSGFLQEAFRLNQQNFQAPGDPNYFTDQQIRQNQATLGQIQNVGALQQNQLQQVQILRQMQQIQEEAQQQRIKDTLYPAKDAQGNSFFATLRQHAALEQLREMGDRQAAADTVRVQQKTTVMENLRRQDGFRAEEEGIPKISDFRDNVLAPLRVRIMQGGEDGKLALKELESLQPDSALSEYTDSFGMRRKSPELRSSLEKMISEARLEARGTYVGKLRDSAIKDLTETQIAADELMSFKEYMPAEKFNEAVALRAEIQKYSLNADYANPDPVAIANLATRVDSFNVGQLKKLREAREGAQVVKEANPFISVTDVKSGPQGVEVKGEKEKPAAASSEVVKSAQEQISKKREEISQNEADIEMLNARKRAGETGSALELKNKDGTSSGIKVEDLIAKNKVLERQLKELQDIYGAPRTGKEEKVAEELSGKGGASTVPNVLQRSPAPSPSGGGTQIPSAATNAPAPYRPALAIPSATNPVPVIRLVKQPDGKITGTFTTPPSTGTNNTAKPK